MLVEILKNPVIFGLLAGVIVYNYMAWNRKKEIEKRLKKGKKIKEEHKYNDIIIPSIVAIIVWFISFAYFNHKEENLGQYGHISQPMHQLQTQSKINIPTIQSLHPLQPLQPLHPLQPLNASPSEIAHSFTMVNKTATGLTMPPDVHI